MSLKDRCVEQGQILVKADTYRLAKPGYRLETPVGLSQSEPGPGSGQRNSAQSNLANAQSGLATAQYNFNQQKDIKAIQDKIDNANTQIQTVMAQYQLSLKSPNSLSLSQSDYLSK